MASRVSHWRPRIVLKESLLMLCYMPIRGVVHDALVERQQLPLQPRRDLGPLFRNILVAGRKKAVNCED